MSITQSRSLNVSVSFPQSTFELCNFNQNMFKTRSWMIIRTISKVIFSWCRRIVMNKSIVFFVIDVLSLSSLIINKLCDCFNLIILNRYLFTINWDIKFDVVLKFTSALMIRSLNSIINLKPCTVCIAFTSWVIAFSSLIVLFIKRLILFSTNVFSCLLHFDASIIQFLMWRLVVARSIVLNFLYVIDNN